MGGSKLTLEYNEVDGAVWLIAESTAGIQHKEPIWLRDGFGIDEVRQAVMATGWVRQDGDRLRLDRDIHCQILRNVVDEMLTYFTAPGVPSRELLEVQSAVAEYEVMRETGSDIPLYAYAWLDVMVREDMADTARSSQDIWGRTKIFSIEVDDHCDRRVQELVSRYSRSSMSGLGRMAASSSTRRADKARGKKTG